MILHAYVDVYVLCVCIVGHGYTTSVVKRAHMKRGNCRLVNLSSLKFESWYKQISKNIRSAYDKFPDFFV